MHLTCLKHTLGTLAVSLRLSLHILFVIKHGTRGHTVCYGGQPCALPIVTYHWKNLSVRVVIMVFWFFLLLWNFLYVQRRACPKLISQSDFKFCCSLCQSSCLGFFYCKTLIEIDFPDSTNFPDVKFDFCIITACEGLNRPCQSGVCDNGICCHPNCIGGCTGETDRDCKVCKNVVSMIKDQAICQKQCLPGTYTVSAVKPG